MGGAPIRFAGESASMGLVRRAVNDDRNAHTDVIEVVNKGSGRSFLASLGLFLNAGVVPLIRSLLS